MDNMWQATLKLNHDDCPIVNRCVKFGINVYSYPSTWYKMDGKKYVTQICFFEGDDEDRKQKFLKDFGDDKYTKKLEISGDIFTYEYELFEHGEHVQLYYDGRMILTKPVLNSLEGYEYWYVASWEKEHITTFVKSLEEHMDYTEVQKIFRGQLKDVYFPNIMPNIPPAQKHALLLAYQNGYYTYPRKMSVQGLAKIAGVVVSTFQENLRKAEIKLMPILIEEHLKLSEPQKDLIVKARIGQKIEK